MQRLKTIISLFLLLVYSVSFAHDLIPHCHLDENTEHISSQHNHQLPHHNDIDNEGFNSKIHHNDGLFGYVACLLGELKHPASGLVFHDYACLNTPNDSKNKPTKINWVGHIAALYNLSEISDPLLSPCGYSNTAVQLKKLSSLAHRGPPLFC